ITAAGELRSLLAVYAEAEDLINIGAYVGGSNPHIDRACRYIESIRNFLRQSSEESTDFQQAVAWLQGMFM
ncbi:MAG TPA: EscN/YscN/HrcN family type III secretion system ATPase, partial [Chthonomonadales bacterium]|nr:EscN/YscN/HrcN family type III secretion system ATPase [Chthonomonadales bacterium]